MRWGMLWLLIGVCGSLFSVEKKEPKYNYLYSVCICSMFKDEAPYLKEWIEYHKLVGVEHFYLLNNDSSDNYLEVLEPYIERDEVTLVDWSGGQGSWCQKVQGPGLLSGVDYYLGVAKWVALIDVDEFIVPVDGRSLVSFLADYEDFAAVVINWQVYGTSFIKDIPQGHLMVEMLTLKAFETHGWNVYTKSIVRPERVDTTQLYWPPHIWVYLEGFDQVAPNREKFVWGKIDVSKIRINHYWLRTDNYLYKEKIEKKERMEKKVSKDEVEYWRTDSNCVEDKIIFKFIPDLKEAVFPTLTESVQL